MADYTTEESWHSLYDGYKVYTKTWKPTSSPAALLLFIHGFSDHINSYYTLFPTLASRNIQTHAFDQRGWGRSVHNPSQRGLTGHTSTVLQDISSLLESLIPIAVSQPVPLFLMGHSMGGAEVLQYAARGPPEIRKQIRGFVLESPYLALHPSAQPSRVIVVAGKLASKLLPRRQMVQKLDAKWLSRDEDVRRDWVEDQLCHDTGTLEGLAGMLERADELDRDVVVLKDEEKGGDVRIWVGHGSEDHVTSFDTSKRWFERLGVKDKEYRIYEGWYHKLHAEPGEDKITFANNVADWILSRAEIDSGQTAAPAKSKL